MADNPHHLLLGNEAREPRGIRIGVCQNSRISILPVDALGTREELLQEGFLTAHFHISMAITQARRTAVSADATETTHCFLSIGLGLEFGVALHGLRTGPIHDYVDRCALFF